MKKVLSFLYKVKVKLNIFINVIKTVHNNAEVCALLNATSYMTVVSIANCSNFTVITVITYLWYGLFLSPYPFFS